MSNPVVYTDDPDASWTFTITDADGNNLTWTPVEVAVDEAGYLLTATWLGTAAPTRKLKVPLDTVLAGYHQLYLKVPGANDILLGKVSVYDRE